VPAAGNRNGLKAILERTSQSMVEQCGGTSMPRLGKFAAPIRNDQCMSAGKSSRESASPSPKYTSIKARRKGAVKRNMTTNSFSSANNYHPSKWLATPNRGDFMI
jgi:hypothetical protein